MQPVLKGCLTHRLRIAGLIEKRLLSTAHLTNPDLTERGNQLTYTITKHSSRAAHIVFHLSLTRLSQT